MELDDHAMPVRFVAHDREAKFHAPSMHVGAHLRDDLRTERDGQALRIVSGGGGLEQEIDDYHYRLVL